MCCFWASRFVCWSVDFFVFEFGLRRLTFGRRKGSIPMPRTFHPTGRAYSLSRQCWRQAGGSQVFLKPAFVEMNLDSVSLCLLDFSVFNWNYIAVRLTNSTTHMSGFNWPNSASEVLTTPSLDTPFLAAHNSLELHAMRPCGEWPSLSPGTSNPEMWPSNSECLGDLEGGGCMDGHGGVVGGGWVFLVGMGWKRRRNQITRCLLSSGGVRKCMNTLRCDRYISCR